MRAGGSSRWVHLLFMLLTEAVREIMLETCHFPEQRDGGGGELETVWCCRILFTRKGGTEGDKGQKVCGLMGKGAGATLLGGHRQSLQLATSLSVTHIFWWVLPSPRLGCVLLRMTVSNADVY